MRPRRRTQARAGVAVRRVTSVPGFDPNQQLFDFPTRTARRQAQDARIAQDPRAETAESREAAFVAPVLETPTSEIRENVRGTDPIESQRAAVDVLKRDCEWIRTRLREIVVLEGPQTAREFEEREEFARAGFAKNTIRRRVTDCKKAAVRGEPGLVEVGRKDKMALWGIAS